MPRPKPGPWLRDEKGPYDDPVAAAVDRLGRHVVDCLNSGYKMRNEKRTLVTYGPTVGHTDESFAGSRGS